MGVRWDKEPLFIEDYIALSVMKSFPQEDGTGEENVTKSLKDELHFHFTFSVLGAASFPHAIL